MKLWHSPLSSSAQTAAAAADRQAHRLFVMIVWGHLLMPFPVPALETGLCQVALGMESGAIPNEHITASSFFDNSVNARYARVRQDMGGGAWCPRNIVYNKGTEFLEVNLGIVNAVTKVEVQGRFGNGQGQEYAQNYKLQYWREGLDHWVTYTNGQRQQVLEGNTNTYLAKSTQLSPPVIASRIRFLPYSDHPRTVCMRVEAYGCPYTGVVTYSMPDGDQRGGDDALRDITYDGTRLKSGWLENGLGQLVDGEMGHTNFRVDAMGRGRGYEWIGWKNDTRGPIEMTFEFDTTRNFSAVHIFTNNFFTKDTQVFSHARIFFSVGGKHFTRTPIPFEYEADRIFEIARNVTIKLRNQPGRFIKIQLYFALRWIMISEVSFDSVPCLCNMTEEVIIKVKEPVPAEDSSSGLLLGVLVTLGVVFGVVPMALGVLYYRTRLSKKNLKKPVSVEGAPLSNVGSNNNGRKVSMKMRDLHINMNLSPMSNGYARAKGKLYGHVEVEEEAAAMYQEPFKGPIHNPGYYTLGRTAMPSDIPFKYDPDDSVDYAVPDMNMTPPPPFSEVYTPPPPVPLTRPPASVPGRTTVCKDTPVPPIPPIPPPPEQYYTAPKLCQASNIQGVTGSVIYAVTDMTHFKEHSVPEVHRHHLHLIETLGEGVFGSVQLCEIDKSSSKTVLTSKKPLAAVKTLKANISDEAEEDFKREIKVLSQLKDPNIVKLVGVVSQKPMAMILEYMEKGDLYQFLRNHIPEDDLTNSSRNEIMSSSFSTSVLKLSYGDLVYIASQVASGMKYLESLNIIHRDLATRNCLVGANLITKISDFGMSRSLYSSDYYKIEGRALLPIRWMAWESILQGRFTTKSDVWSFGVTLWEILTMARRQPYDELSDEGVLENVSHCYHSDGSGMILLPQPSSCPREIYDMMIACWRPEERQRPPFWEILMFLQRKNLGYTLDYVE